MSWHPKRIWSSIFVHYFHIFTFKLGDLDFFLVIHFIVFIVFLHHKVSEVVRPHANLEPNTRLFFYKKELIVNDTDVVVCHKFPLS